MRKKSVYASIRSTSKFFSLNNRKADAKKMSAQDELSSQRKHEILEVLNSFFAKEHNFVKLEKILKKEIKVSLRTLEFAASHSHRFYSGLQLHGAYQNYLSSAG